ATMRLLREGLLARAIRSERVDPDDMLKLDAALKSYLPQGKPPTITVNFVKTLQARCPHCHKLSEVSAEPFENEPRQTHPDPAVAARAIAATRHPRQPSRRSPSRTVLRSRDIVRALALRPCTPAFSATARCLR